jgi:hypothetical protein
MCCSKARRKLADLLCDQRVNFIDRTGLESRRPIESPHAFVDARANPEDGNAAKPSISSAAELMTMRVSQVEKDDLAMERSQTFANREKFRENSTPRRAPLIASVRPRAGYRALNASEPQIEQGTSREILTGCWEQAAQNTAERRLTSAWSTETLCGYCPTNTRSKEMRNFAIRTGPSLGLLDFLCPALSEPVYSTRMWVRRVIGQFSRNVRDSNLRKNTTFPPARGPTIKRDCLLRAGYIHWGGNQRALDMSRPGCCFVLLASRDDNGKQLKNVGDK